MVLTDLGAARYGPFTFPYGEPGGCDRFMQVFSGRDRTGNNGSLAPSRVEVPQSISPGGAGNGHPRVSRPHISDRSESAPERFFPRSQAASRRARRPKAKASDPFGNRFSAQESLPRCPPGLRHPGCGGRRDREGVRGLKHSTHPTSPPIPVTIGHRTRPPSRPEDTARPPDNRRNEDAGSHPVPSSKFNEKRAIPVTVATWAVWEGEAGRSRRPRSGREQNGTVPDSAGRGRPPHAPGPFEPRSRPVRLPAVAPFCAAFYP
jgi:hypothetical protein